MALYELDSGTTPVSTHVPLEPALLDELRPLLARLGHASSSEPESVLVALKAWVAGANLGPRWWGQPAIDPAVLARLRALG
jgi:hypothetical protein